MEQLFKMKKKKRKYIKFLEYITEQNRNKYRDMANCS